MWLDKAAHADSSEQSVSQESKEKRLLCLRAAARFIFPHFTQMPCLPNKTENSLFLGVKTKLIVGHISSFERFFQSALKYSVLIVWPTFLYFLQLATEDLLKSQLGCVFMYIIFFAFQLLSLWVATVNPLSNMILRTLFAHYRHTMLLPTCQNYPQIYSWQKCSHGDFHWL